MSKLQQHFDNAPRQHSPADLDSRILARAEQQAAQHREHQTSRSLFTQLSWPWVPLAASGVIAGVLTLLVIRPALHAPDTYAPPPYAPPAASETHLSANSARNSTKESTGTSIATPIAEEISTESMELRREINKLSKIETMALIEAESPTVSSLANAAPQSGAVPETAAAPLASLSDAASAERINESARTKQQKPVLRSASKSVTTSVEGNIADISADAHNAALPADATEFRQQTRDWLQSLAPDSFVLQLSISRDREALTEELRNAGFDPNNIFLLPLTLRGDAGYASLVGSFASETEAYNQAQRISQRSRLQPWVRLVRDVLASTDW